MSSIEAVLLCCCNVTPPTECWVRFGRCPCDSWDEDKFGEPPEWYVSCQALTDAGATQGQVTFGATDGHCYTGLFDDTTKLDALPLGGIVLTITGLSDDCDECCPDVPPPPCYINALPCCGSLIPGISFTCEEYEAFVDTLPPPFKDVWKINGKCYNIGIAATSTTLTPQFGVITLATSVQAFFDNCSVGATCQCPPNCTLCQTFGTVDCPKPTEVVVQLSYGPAYDSDCFCFAENRDGVCRLPPPVMTLCMYGCTSPFPGSGGGPCNCQVIEQVGGYTLCCTGMLADQAGCQIIYCSGMSCVQNLPPLPGEPDPPFGQTPPVPGMVRYAITVTIQTSTECSLSADCGGCPKQFEELFGLNQPCADLCTGNFYDCLFVSDWLEPCTCWTEVGQWFFWNKQPSVSRVTGGALLSIS